jgi:hypothetical protein
LAPQAGKPTELMALSVCLSHRVTPEAVREEQHDLVQAAEAQALYGGLLTRRQRRLEAQPIWPLEHTQGDSHDGCISLKHTSTSVNSNLHNQNHNNTVHIKLHVP